jgi:integrase
MAKSHLKLVKPTIKKRTVTPTRRRNGDLRTREYLTEAEVDRLIAATKGNRWGHRDAAMILVAFRHGLRASELVDLRWDQVEFRAATLHVRRVKQGTPSVHPIVGDELRALRRLQREQEPQWAGAAALAVSGFDPIAGGDRPERQRSPLDEPRPAPRARGDSQNVGKRRTVQALVQAG